MLLEELRPVGALEVFLAARVIDLTWRLHRAAQDQNEVFGALYERHTAGTPEPADRAERGATLGRMILEDFSGEAVLERLLRHERRIESSLYRTLNELRRVHDQGRKADQETLGTLVRWREEDDQARKERAFAFCRPADPPAWPAGDTTNTLRSEVSQPCDIPSRPETRSPADWPAEDEICETNPIRAGLDMGQVLSAAEVMSDSAPSAPGKTNPISGAAGGTGIPSASLSGQALSMSLDHGRDAHATRPPAGGTASPAGGNCAKRTQLARESQVCSVECQASGPERAKRTQFGPQASPAGGLLCQTRSSAFGAPSFPQTDASGIRRRMPATVPEFKTPSLFSLI
jgi:hypothetical protein